MEEKKNRIIPLLLCGILGCIFMGASDWLMIYGDTAYHGSLAWLTEGAAVIPAWRNALAMGLAFPAVIFYCVGLMGIRKLLMTQSGRKTYTVLTCLGMTPWLCLHLFYTMILFLFSWMTAGGQQALGLEACEAMFRQFVWLVPVGEVLMVLPFGWLIYLVAAKKSFFSPWMAWNNPLIIYAVLKAVTLLMPDCPFRLAFVNGLMSESMAIWFLIWIAAVMHR